LKHQFLQLVQVAFLDAQKAENNFAWTFDPSIHRFLDFTQIGDSQKADIEFSLAFAL
jgi:hypothetical protein